MGAVIKPLLLIYDERVVTVAERLNVDLADSAVANGPKFVAPELFVIETSRKPGALSSFRLKKSF